jgi:hypothetical protein
MRSPSRWLSCGAHERPRRARTRGLRGTECRGVLLPNGTSRPRDRSTGLGGAAPRVEAPRSGTHGSTTTSMSRCDTLRRTEDSTRARRSGIGLTSRRGAVGKVAGERRSVTISGPCCGRLRRAAGSGARERPALGCRRLAAPGFQPDPCPRVTAGLPDRRHRRWHGGTSAHSRSAST